MALKLAARRKAGWQVFALTGSCFTRWEPICDVQHDENGKLWVKENYGLGAWFRPDAIRLDTVRPTVTTRKGE